MKRKILLLTICLLCAFTLAFTSCTEEEGSNVSIFDTYDAIEQLLDLNIKGLNSKNEYINSGKYIAASENYLLIRENVTVDGFEMKKLTVKDIRTNGEIYSITYDDGTEELSKIYDVEIILGSDKHSLNNIGKDYFVITTKENGKEYSQEDIITVEIHNIKNERICSYKGSLDNFEDLNCVAKMDIHLEQKSPCVFQKNDHIFFMNKLYRQEENGLVLVKELESERLLSLDYTCFTYMNERYVYNSSDGEFYVFDKEFNFVRYEKVDVPFGYNYTFVGFLSLDKLVYVLDKRVDKDELNEGEEYDFIFDGVAYTREFHTYNVATGNTGNVDDILYRDTVAILCKDYLNLNRDGEEIDFGADVLLETDLEMIDGKYYERESLTYTTDELLYTFLKVDKEISGFSAPDVNILGKLSTGNYVVSLPFEIAVYNKNKEKLGSIDGEVLDITDKYIITEKGIYNHDLEIKYLFAGNEAYYATVGDTPIVVALTVGDKSALDEKIYYSIIDTGKAEIAKTDLNSYGSIDCFESFYRVRKQADDKYITAFYFENGEVMAEFEFSTPYDELNIYFTKLEDAVIICYENDTEYQYVYAYVK